MGRFRWLTNSKKLQLLTFSEGERLEVHPKFGLKFTPNVSNDLGVWKNLRSGKIKILIMVNLLVYTDIIFL